MYCQSTFDPSWEVTLIWLGGHASICCQMSPNCTVRAPSICLWELHLHYVPVGPDFVCQIIRGILLVLD